VSEEAILGAENSEKNLWSGQGSAKNPTGELTALLRPVIWSETVGLRTRPVSDQKNRSWSWSCRFFCCDVKYNLVTLVVKMISEDTTAFQILFIVSLFCAWTSLLWRSTVAFTYLKVKSAKCLLFTSGGLGLVSRVLVLVLLFWSWS